MGQLKSAVWFTTMACNFKCHYCWEVQAQERGEFPRESVKDWDYRPWVAAWNRLRPGILDITGGEPFLLPGFIDLLKGIGDHTRIAITTNLSRDMTGFVQEISPSKVFSITASFHPTENRMSFALFLGRIKMLQNRGFHVTVNYVGWPEQLWLTDHFRGVFQNFGIPFHFDPYSSIAYYPFKFNEKESAYIRSQAGDDRKPDPLVEKHGRDFAVNCSGGMDHLSVQPDGSAWRCILDRQLNINPLGSILDESFALSDKVSLCFERHRCPGCDKDKVSVHVKEKWTPEMVVAEREKFVPLTVAGG